MKIFQPKALPPNLSAIARSQVDVIMKRGQTGTLLPHSTANSPILQGVNNPKVPHPHVNLYAGYPDPLVAYQGTYGDARSLKIGADNWHGLVPGEQITASAELVCDRVAGSDGAEAWMILWALSADGVWTAQASAASSSPDPTRLAATLTLPASALAMDSVGIGVWKIGGSAGFPGLAALQNIVVVRGAVAPPVWNEGGGLFVLNPQAYTNYVVNNHNTAALPALYLTGGAAGSRSWEPGPFHAEVLRITKTGGALGDRVGVSWPVQAMGMANAHTASMWVRRPAGTVDGFAVYADMVHAGGTVTAARGLAQVPPDVWTKAVAASPFTTPAVNYTSGTVYAWVDGPVGSYIDVVLPNVIAGLRPNDASGWPADFATVRTGASTNTTAADTLFVNFGGAGQETGQNGSTAALLLTNAESSQNWSMGTPYVSGERVTYSASEYQRNSVAYTDTSQQLFRNPTLEPTLWGRVGPAAKLLAFDGEINTRTYLKPAPTPWAGTLWFMGAMELFSDSLLISDVVGVHKLHVQVRRGASGPVVADFTHDWETCGEQARSQYLVTGLTPSADLVFQVAAYGPLNPGIGLITWGQTEELGETMYGARAGIVDYSRKESDEFGQVVFVRRSFSKTLDASVVVKKADLNRVQDTLNGLRATPAVWIFSDDAAHAVPLVVYGFYGDFYTVLDRPLEAVCTLQVKGLA